MKDRVWARGCLVVHKYDASGKLCGREVAENLFITSGINELWALFSGASANHFDNANARIGIGDSSAAAADTQTDLQAASNKTYKGMDATYPLAPTNKQIVYRATFASGDANFAWNEFALKHNGSGVCLDRGVQPMGTKVAGTTWVATLTLSLA